MVFGGPDVIRKEAWSFYRTISGVRLCWELEEPKGPKGCPSTPELLDGVRSARHCETFDAPFEDTL